MNFGHNFIVADILSGITNDMVQTCSEFINKAFSFMIGLSDFSGLANESYDILPTYNDSWTAFTNPDYIAKPFIQVGASAGMALLVIFTITGLIGAFFSERVSLETLVKPLVTFFATAILIANIDKIIAVLWNFGITFADNIQQTGNATLNEVVKFEISGGTFGLAAGLLCITLILGLLVIIIGAIIRLCAYIANFGRIIEVGVRSVLLPIAIGMAGDHEMRQGAIRQIKKFFAVCLQGGVFALISMLYSRLAAKVMEKSVEWITSQQADGMLSELNDITNTAHDIMNAGSIVVPTVFLPLQGGEMLGIVVVGVLGSIIPIVGLGIACVTVLFRSGQICNDIVGG